MSPKSKSAKKVASKTPAAFHLTYATMFEPPEELHTSYDRALARVRGDLGREYPLLVGGEERRSAEQFEDRSPIDTDWLLGRFQKGGVEDARAAIAAARAAFPTWSALPWQRRVRYLRAAAALINKRVFEFAAIDSLEVGKNRMEALGDVQETADLIAYYCDLMERFDGYVTPMGRDPLKGFTASNTSLLRPYGVWVVISPWNFPVALSGGPSGAALLAGNTVVAKPATDTPWVGWFLARCFLDAGLPKGVYNFVTGPGGTLGEELIANPGVDGITFTGSFDVGMHIYRGFAGGKWPRPCIAEMGGKNATIVSRHADLDQAALGCYRSAFGLQGQKCSATSRIFVERAVKDKLIARLLALLERTNIGDPTVRENWLGPVANAAGARSYENYCAELRQAGTILFGGRRLTQGPLAKGYFCAPTLVDNVPAAHRLWREEMFLPIAMIAGVESLEEGMRRANDADYGLTAGFYGSPREAQWFFDRVESGTCYANRPQGATTGAWPGLQPFGGWKGSGSTGKSAGGLFYLPQFMREQSRTLISEKK
ncbi:MAG TPA: aldehyde dehydrogenase family protein [Gemmatimonadales bacterium]|nr:aldehyde dehydrogenase family protein [Gemmatimonadales bacterium]